MKSKFTLIELIIVIAVLGILSVIIIPNVSHIQGKSVISASIADMRILQTASDMYSVEHLQFASVEKPTSKMPQSLDFSKVYPKYIRSLPKENYYYWIDVLGKVWSSPIDAPKVTSIAGNHVTWDKVPGAVQYQIYEISNKKTMSSMNEEQVTYKKVTTIDQGSLFYNGDVSKSYAVSSIHQDGYESAPIGDLNYKYVDTIGLKPSGGNGNNEAEPETDNANPITVIRMNPDAGLKTDTTILWEHDSTYTKGTIENVEWKVDGVIVATPPSRFSNGTHTVELRVQGSDGVWSNVSTKTFHVEKVQYEAIFAKGYYSMYVYKDGTVWATGNNDSGQLGNEEMSSTKSPIKIQNLDGVKKVTNNLNSSLALKNDGTVWGWGYNQFGQLGDGTTTVVRYNPVQTQGLTNVKEIVSGNNHSLAIKNDGTVWGWGYNNNGQIGDGSTVNRTTPIQIQGLDHIQQISIGADHNIALKEDGTVWVWGANSNGQLGVGDKVGRSTPVKIQDISDVKAVYTGVSHSFAIKNDGTVWGWGTNTQGQLGDGTQVNRLTPVLIPNLLNPKKITGGTNYSVALKYDGTVLAWGNNTQGQLGDGTKTISLSPKIVNKITNAIDIASGINHSLALDGNGDLWAWGGNVYGQYGNDTTTSVLEPVIVTK